MEINKVLVVGCGQMGHGIAQVCATGGAQVYMYDVSRPAAERGLAKIKESLARSVQKGKLEAAKAADIEARLALVDSYDAAAGVDMCVEAAIENIDVKRKIATELDAIMGENVILATTTSALPITEVTNKTKHPERTIGTHFHHPPVVMRLVEIVNGYYTSPEVTETVIKFLAKAGKVPVPCKDYPGFVSSRVGIQMINEGIHALYEGVSKPEDIDAACEHGFNWPMGPLRLADLIGLETILMILEDMTAKMGSRFMPSPLLRQMVAAGRLGQKVGKGFYTYAEKR
ncbi:MAG: 3-hydroxyacyl-CoA dehydrogenase family protein [Pseudorhodoplanes sp.]|nr:3-hydroxyacyl-CoA dehydrogenase family protein [Pseudorhodoplanes sp.]